MLQLTTFACNIGKNSAPKLLWRFSALFSTNSAKTVNPLKQDDINTNNTKLKYIQENVSKELHNSVPTTKNKTHNLKIKDQIMKKDFEQKLQSVENVDEILNIAESSPLNKDTATLLLTKIIQRINSNSQGTIDCTKDTRFKKIQDVLFSIELKGKGQLVHPKTTDILRKLQNGDINLISHLSIDQLIEVLQKLSISRVRPVPILRLLAQSIAKDNMYLDIRKCKTILYSLASLSFYDEALLQCVKRNILEGLEQETDKVITWKVISIVKSLGVLHYKDEELLNKLCNFCIHNITAIGVYELQTLVETVATLNYKTNETMLLLKMCADLVNQQHKNSVAWLDIVWALVMFQMADEATVSSVLSENFIQSLSTQKLTVLKKLKLLNINAAANYEMNYTGNVLSVNSKIYQTPPIKSKETEVYTQTLSETLDKILPAKHFQTHVNTHMGFLLDAEYFVNSDGYPVAYEHKFESSNMKRVGIMIHHYNDYCRMHPDLLGRITLYKRLLSAKGYKLISIDYRDFSPADSWEKRFEFLKKQLAINLQN